MGAALALAAPASALAQGGTSVEGRVVHGANPGANLSGVSVVLHQQSLGEDLPVEAATDAEGRFRFEGVEVVPGSAYGVSVEYQGALYGKDVVVVPGRSAEVTLTVYDATHDALVLEVASASVLFSSVNRRHQWVGALEMVSVRNASDHTFVPGPEPMNLLRFDLPPGARDLEVRTDLVGAEVLQVDRGFGLNAAVPPGDHDMLWVYQFPYSGASASFTRSFLYKAGQVRFLIPTQVGTVSITSPQMGPAQAVAIGDRTYQILTANGLAANQEVEVTLGGLPQPTLVDRLARTTEAVPLQYAAPAALAVVAVVVVAYALLRSRRRHRNGPGVPLEATASEHDDG